MRTVDQIVRSVGNLTMTGRPTTIGSVKPPQVATAGSKIRLPVDNPRESFWTKGVKHELHDHRSTELLPEHSDIVIIGAGYAGISTAYHLTKDTKSTSKPSICILEARGVCSGATGRNGGHLRPDLYGHIPTYVDRAGLDAAVEIAEFEISHVRAVKKVIEDEGIDCDFSLCRSIDTWCNEESAAKAKEVYEHMKATKSAYLDDVIFHTGPEVEGICGVKEAKACASYTAGSLWPYKFILALTSIILATNRVNLQTNTPATEIIPCPSGGYTITTPRGTIHATKVIHCNNAYVSALLPEYKDNIVPCKGICSHITVPPGTRAPLLNNTYINRTQDNVLTYLIPRSDGSIIAGGAAAIFRPYRKQWYDNVDDSILIDSAKDFYTGYMQRTYNGWENSGATISTIWSGVMGYSYDSNPHIGPVPQRENQFILAGFNGHGMPVIWLSAKGIAEMVLGDGEFEGKGIPRLFRTTAGRIERAQTGSVEDGDILGVGKFGATKQ